MAGHRIWECSRFPSRESSINYKDTIFVLSFVFNNCLNHSETGLDGPLLPENDCLELIVTSTIFCAKTCIPPNLHPQTTCISRKWIKRNRNDSSGGVLVLLVLTVVVTCLQNTSTNIKSMKSNNTKVQESRKARESLLAATYLLKLHVVFYVQIVYSHASSIIRVLLCTEARIP